ncbi:MAG: hypothetical protein ABSD10_02690 [Candidatus Saccharimonadales bacterium]
MKRIETDPEVLRILDEAPIDLPVSTRHVLELARLARVHGLSTRDVYGWIIEKRIERQTGTPDHG